MAWLVAISYTCAPASPFNTWSTKLIQQSCRSTFLLFFYYCFILFNFKNQTLAFCATFWPFLKLSVGSSAKRTALIPVILESVCNNSLKSGLEFWISPLGRQKGSPRKHACGMETLCIKGLSYIDHISWTPKLILMKYGTFELVSQPKTDFAKKNKKIEKNIPLYFKI